MSKKRHIKLDGAGKNPYRFNPEQILAAKKNGKKAHKKRGVPQKTPKSPTFMRFFEQNADQAETTVRARGFAEKILYNPEENLIRNNRGLLSEQILHGGLEDEKGKTVELFESKADKILEDERLKRKMFQDKMWQSKTPGDRQLKKKLESRERKQRIALRRRKAA